MNLFLNALIVYFLPIFIYTIGKNEYIENADDHRLNQRTDLDYSLRDAISGAWNIQ